MNEITTAGLDLARNVFQVHAVDATGAVVIRRQVRRAQMLLFFSRLKPCLIGIVACAGAHFRARELAKPGHEVRLIPPFCVKPFVKRGKTDAADAEAICTAVVQPVMRFVTGKTGTQQAVLISHRTRDFLVRQLTRLANAIRAHFGEFGLVVPKGVHNMSRLVAQADAADLPRAERECRWSCWSGSSVIRRRASTPSPPICAARRLPMRPHGAFRRCRVLAPSPPVF